jgi:2-keto-3-deoxy-L-rhamnonate aldolase RhmA
MIDDLPRNNFKRGLAAGAPQIGLWLSMTSPVATEVVAGAGFDWMLVDMEHSANDLVEVASHLRAAVGGSAEPVVRVPWNEPVMVKRVLDIGARSLLFPFVQSAEEARRAVAATRYPPKGIRGVAGTTRANRYGRVKDYAKRVEDELCVLVQVETQQALGEIEAIAAVDGVDGMFIGPADLSASMGHLGNWQRPEIWQAIISAGERIRKAGKAPGFLSAREDECRAVLAAGFQFVAVGSDIGILARQSEALARSYKSPEAAT